MSNTCKRYKSVLLRRKTTAILCDCTKQVYSYGLKDKHINRKKKSRNQPSTDGQTTDYRQTQSSSKSTTRWNGRQKNTHVCKWFTTGIVFVFVCSCISFSCTKICNIFNWRWRKLAGLMLDSFRLFFHSGISVRRQKASVESHWYS